MKIAMGLIVWVTFCGVLNAQSHDIQWGNITDNDILLYRRLVVKISSWLKIVVTDIHYPQDSIFQPRDRIISCIRADDQYINGNGGFATLTAGGVGFNHTTVHFKSQRGHGLSFILEIYGQ